MAEQRTTPIRVMLVDAHPAFRGGLAALLRGVEDVAAVAEAGSAASASARAQEQKPHVVLVGDGLRDANLPETVHAILAAAPDSAIALLVEDERDEDAFAAVRAGALGFLPKAAGLQQFRDGIRQLRHGGAVVTPVLAGRILGEFRMLSAAGPSVARPWVSLSDRESEILKCVMLGWRADEIAERFEIAPTTVHALLRATLDVLHHLPGPDEDGGDFSGDRAPRPRPGGSPVRVASVALPLPERDYPPPDWLIRAFPNGFDFDNPTV